MFKKTFLLVLVLALLVSASAMAEVTNRDMQLLGGYVVSNSSDSFFFAPMEKGLTQHWGLYRLSTASQGPLVEIREGGYPARLVYASNDKVYFLGYTDAERTIHALYSVEINSGKSALLLSDISAAFVGNGDDMLYVKSSDLYTLRSFTFSNEKDKSIKDMSNSEKTIYDAGIYDGSLYFLTKSASGSEDGYLYNESSGKANNLDKPSPSVLSGMLYEGYRLYATDQQGTQVYALKIGSKNAKQLGSGIAVSMTHPRFGQYLYTYDGDADQLVAVPLDGSDLIRLTLDGGTLKRMVMGGTKDEIYIINNDAVYAMPTNLSSQTKLFDFDQRTGGQAWATIAPAGSNAIIIFGYDQDTLSYMNNLMPTGVYAFNRGTGEMLFGFPEWDESMIEEQEANQTNERPEQIGAPTPEQEEGETYFVFSTDG